MVEAEAEGAVGADVSITPVCEGVRRTDLLYSGGGDALRSILDVAIMEEVARELEAGPGGFEVA